MNTISVLSSDVHCRACDGTGVFIPVEFLELESNIASVLREFPLPDIMGKGQWFFKSRTIVRFLAYMYQKQDVEGRRIACLAAPTIATGLAILKEKAKLNLSISLLDIDVDVLEVVNKIFPSVDIHEYDISENCPQNLAGNFDCFVFDPLYSIDHYRIGLSRCAELVGTGHPDKVGYVILPPEEIAPIRTKREGKTIPLQLAVFGHVNQMGWCISDFKENFMEYSTPPAEAGILQRRPSLLFNENHLDDWRGSDLVRIISTSVTKPVVDGPVSLEKRINYSRRIGLSHNFVRLEEITSGELCRFCTRCFSSHVEDQKKEHYSGYWKPELLTRPMPSWRATGDQPFEIAPSCVGLENIESGELFILRGPAAKAIWETVFSLDPELEEHIVINDILDISLQDFSELDQEQVKKDVDSFLQELMKIRLIKARKLR